MGIDDHILIKTSLTMEEVLSAIMSRFEENFEVVEEWINPSGTRGMSAACKYFILGLYQPDDDMRVGVPSNLGIEPNVRGVFRYYYGPYNQRDDENDYFTSEDLTLHRIWVYEELIKLTEQYDWQIVASYEYLEDYMFVKRDEELRLSDQFEHWMPAFLASLTIPYQITTILTEEKDHAPEVTTSKRTSKRR